MIKHLMRNKSCMLLVCLFHLQCVRINMLYLYKVVKTLKMCSKDQDRCSLHGHDPDTNMSVICIAYFYHGNLLLNSYHKPHVKAAVLSSVSFLFSS